jgi:hypothetical protein
VQFVGDGTDTEAFSREPIEIIPDRSRVPAGRARAVTRAS